MSTETKTDSTPTLAAEASKFDSPASFLKAWKTLTATGKTEARKGDSWSIKIMDLVKDACNKVKETVETDKPEFTTKVIEELNASPVLAELASAVGTGIEEMMGLDKNMTVVVLFTDNCLRANAARLKHRLAVSMAARIMRPARGKNEYFESRDILVTDEVTVNELELDLTQASGTVPAFGYTSLPKALAWETILSYMIHKTKGGEVNAYEFIKTDDKDVMKAVRESLKEPGIKELEWQLGARNALGWVL